MKKTLKSHDSRFFFIEQANKKRLEKSVEEMREVNLKYERAI
jgi:hypothetical protein